MTVLRQMSLFTHHCIITAGSGAFCFPDDDFFCVMSYKYKNTAVFETSSNGKLIVVKQFRPLHITIALASTRPSNWTGTVTADPGVEIIYNPAYVNMLKSLFTKMVTTETHTPSHMQHAHYNVKRKTYDRKVTCCIYCASWYFKSGSRIVSEIFLRSLAYSK